MHGLFKPRVLLSDLSVAGPDTVSEALQIPELKDAMTAEYNALMHNRLGLWSLTLQM